MGPIRDLGNDMMTMQVDQIPPTSFLHFEQALRMVRPSVAPSDLDQYLDWNRQFGTFDVAA